MMHLRVLKDGRAFTVREDASHEIEKNLSRDCQEEATPAQK
jgi:hypothetical protein